MSLKVSRILHAGYIFECAGTSIAFDAIFENPFSKNCHAFPPIEFDYSKIKQLQFSAVFISHFHDDHCSLESLNYLNRATPIYIYCLHEELIDWIRELGFQEVHALDLNIPVHIGAFEIIPRRALDADVDSLFQIKAAGLNILNVVDSWIDDDTLNLLKSQGRWDLILWPFQTMRELEVISPLRAEAAVKEIPDEWVTQLKTLQPRLLVPSSCQFKQEAWSWYNHAFFPISYKDFSDQIKQVLSQAQVVRLDPGVSINLSATEFEPAQPLPWITPLAPAGSDYEYRSDLKPPGTSDVAANFPALSGPQMGRVFKYCTEEIKKKYESLEISEDSYFYKPRVWKLSLYPQQGEATDFYYQIQENTIELFPGPTDNFMWLTEVPAFKLWNALEAGETLTSMYMRINDVFFSAQIEAELKWTDIAEDPLIRCLFDGVFGAYQKAQLESIKARNYQSP